VLPGHNRCTGRQLPVLKPKRFKNGNWNALEETGGPLETGGDRQAANERSSQALAVLDLGYPCRAQASLEEAHNPCVTGSGEAAKRLRASGLLAVTNRAFRHFNHYCIRRVTLKLSVPSWNFPLGSSQLAPSWSLKLELPTTTCGRRFTIELP